jgi:hypothetical protein
MVCALSFSRIERRTSLIFGGDDSLDRCEVALAKRVVLLAIKTFPPSVGLSGIDPVVHDAPADEPRYLLISIPPVKQQSITAVWAAVDSKLRNFHDPSPVVADVAVPAVSDSSELLALYAD